MFSLGHGLIPSPHNPNPPSAPVCPAQSGPTGPAHGAGLQPFSSHRTGIPRRKGRPARCSPCLDSDAFPRPSPFSERPGNGPVRNGPAPERSPRPGPAGAPSGRKPSARMPGRSSRSGSGRNRANASISLAQKKASIPETPDRSGSRPSFPDVTRARKRKRAAETALSGP
jgi:hypothetical protein